MISPLNKEPKNGPFGVVWFGDPHLDSNGCNWPALKEHIEITSETPYLYGANVGDTLDNWPKNSRLARLLAHSDTSEQTAWKLAKWFLEDSGVSWLLWLMGNHGMFSTELPKILREMNTQRIPMEDWGARFILKTENDEFKIWASHNFPGHSQWNTMHGPLKAAKLHEEADLYVCGHTHNWALHQEESASRQFVYWLVRCRGYKYIDEYATRLGHFPQSIGASIVTIFNPGAPLGQRAVCFPDVRQGADYLNYLRSGKG